MRIFRVGRIFCRINVSSGPNAHQGFNANTVTTGDRKDSDPEVPTMGGIERQSEDNDTPWTGGKPMRGWNGLVVRVPHTIYPTQFRPRSIVYVHSVAFFLVADNKE